MKETTHTH